MTPTLKTNNISVMNSFSLKLTFKGGQEPLHICKIFKRIFFRFVDSDNHSLAEDRRARDSHASIVDCSSTACIVIGFCFDTLLLA